MEMQQEANNEVQMEKNNYNELYPRPNEVLCSLMKKYLEDGAKIDIGKFMEIKGKRLYPLHIKKSIKLFEDFKCQNCTGSHQYIIAGGYASYLADLTHAFTDIDVYIHCNKSMEQKTIITQDTKLRTHRNVCTLSFMSPHHKPRVQFIQVKFDIGVAEHLQKSEAFRNLMTMYVLTKFDLPICRVAVRLSLSLNLNIAYIVNASAFNVYKTPTSEARRAKYEARENKERKIDAPSLQLATLFNLINRYC